MEKLSFLTELAEELKARGITINITQNGKVILRMGDGVNPGLLGFVGPVEVRDLKALLKFILG